MASRRQVHHCRRRVHAAMRKGVVPQQDSGSASPGGKPQKAVQAQKAQKG